MLLIFKFGMLSFFRIISWATKESITTKWRRTGTP